MKPLQALWTVIWEFSRKSWFTIFNWSKITFDRSNALFNRLNALFYRSNRNRATLDIGFCTHDLIKEDDWSDHPCTKKKKKLFLHHMHQFVLASHALICSCIVCSNSFIAYHKNDPEILTVATVFSVFESNHRIERYHMIKFAQSACIVFR